jgi:hypothetical protein
MQYPACPSGNQPTVLCAAYLDADEGDRTVACNDMSSRQVAGVSDNERRAGEIAGGMNRTLLEYGSCATYAWVDGAPSNGNKGLRLAPATIESRNPIHKRSGCEAASDQVVKSVVQASCTSVCDRGPFGLSGCCIDAKLFANSLPKTAKQGRITIGCAKTL